LLAVTTNPVAPLCHRFDPAELRGRIAQELPGVPVLDVLAPAALRGLAFRTPLRRVIRVSPAEKRGGL
jgi:hypothetical protein